jgi:hypothetical protein
VWDRAFNPRSAQQNRLLPRIFLHYSSAMCTPVSSRSYKWQFWSPLLPHTDIEDALVSWDIFKLKITFFLDTTNLDKLIFVGGTSRYHSFRSPYLLTFITAAIATALRTERPIGRRSSPAGGGGANLFISPYRLNRLWGHRASYKKGIKCSFYVSKSAYAWSLSPTADWYLDPEHVIYTSKLPPPIHLQGVVLS